MNLTASQINNSWQRFKVQYIAAACGLAIAASALVAVAPWESDQRPGTPALGLTETQVGTFGDAAEASMRVSEGVAGVTLQSSPVTTQPAQSYIYVVSSQEQASALASVFASDSYNDVSESSRIVMVVDSEEAERNLRILHSELVVAGNETVSVVDLR